MNIQYWFFGNVAERNDCTQGSKPCGPGNQASNTAYSGASAGNSLGTAGNETWASGGVATGPGQPNAWESQAFARSIFWDTFTVTSSVLAPGTLVNIDLAIDFTSVGGGVTDSWYSAATFAYGGTGGGLFGVRHGYQGLPGISVNGLYTFSFQQVVGQTFKLFGITDAFSGGTNASGSQFGTNNTVKATANYYVDPGSLAATVGTSALGVGSMGAPVPQFTVTSESGHDYRRNAAIVAPEPSTFALLLLGVGGCAVIARRRRVV